MKERPILFSGPMVRAILEGRKTQTRRVVKPQPYFNGCPGEESNPAEWLTMYSFNEGDPISLGELLKYNPENIKPYYGQPGDRLWVRETWYCDHFAAGDMELTKKDYVSGGPQTFDDCVKEWLGDENTGSMMYYRADVPSGRFQDAGYFSEPGSRWEPSIHMPRWASRILLEITDVRVERLQEISESDATREGVTMETGIYSFKDKMQMEHFDAKIAFEELWDSINEKRGYGWDQNPWVWVIELKVLNPPKGKERG